MLRSVAVRGLVHRVYSAKSLQSVHWTKNNILYIYCNTMCCTFRGAIVSNICIVSTNLFVRYR